MAVAVGYLAERAAAVRSWRRQARTGTPSSARAPLGSARECARERAVWSSPRCNAKQDASVDCRDGGGWPWRSDISQGVPRPCAPGGGRLEPARRRPHERRSARPENALESVPSGRALGATRGKKQELIAETAADGRGGRISRRARRGRALLAAAGSNRHAAVRTSAARLGPRMGSTACRLVEPSVQREARCKR
jgi:hypothetical protein